MLAVDNRPREGAPHERAATLALWALVAVVSPSSELVLQLSAGAVPGSLLWFRIGVLAAVLAIGVIDASARTLRAFCLAYGFQLIVVAVLRAISDSNFYQALVARDGFVGSTLLLKAVTFAMLAPAIVWFLRQRD